MTSAFVLYSSLVVSLTCTVYFYGCFVHYYLNFHYESLNNNWQWL